MTIYVAVGTTLVLLVLPLVLLSLLFVLVRTLLVSFLFAVFTLFGSLGIKCGFPLTLFTDARVLVGEDAKFDVLRSLFG
jgi:hypothetical protein